ncbi:MAG: hypothetical protein P1P93_12085 [Gammaproteobacteria bacterium]|nr:hypothetical protein [Gammaproteobacteria bacterium]
MFSFRAKLTKSTAGITFSKDGIALAVIEHRFGKPALLHSQFYLCSSDQRASRLTQLAKQHKLDTIPCNLALAPDEYQILQVDAPEVPKQELASALRWHIKDLISFHIDDVVIEHVERVIQNTSGKQQIQVIVCRQSIIQNYVDLLLKAQCNLASIDIAIFSARNILAHIDTINPSNSTGLLNLWDEYSRISVLLGHGVGINRQSTIGLNALSFISSEPSSLTIIDTLALEIQRTFDYYESHFRQAAIEQLVIINNGQAISDLAQLFQQRLGIPCDLISITDAISCDNPDTISPNCITAIGGALRMEQ